MALALALLAAACSGAGTGQRTAQVRDVGATPAYDTFLRNLRGERLTVRAVSMKQVNGHWTSPEAAAVKGCQCAETWATLYVEHRLRVNGSDVLVDEELAAGATAELEPTNTAGAATRHDVHWYRLDNLFIVTGSSDARLLAVLDKLNRAKAFAQPAD